MVNGIRSCQKLSLIVSFKMVKKVMNIPWEHPTRENGFKLLLLDNVAMPLFSSSDVHLVD